MKVEVCITYFLASELSCRAIIDRLMKNLQMEPKGINKDHKNQRDRYVDEYWSREVNFGNPSDLLNIEVACEEIFEDTQYYGGKNKISICDERGRMMCIHTDT
jgi:hypothetical protein